MGSPPTIPTTDAQATPPAAAPTLNPPQRLWANFVSLSPLTKGILAVVLIVLLIACWIWMGHVSTDDAQVDCHITSVAPQVPGYVVQLMINDNIPVVQGQVLLMGSSGFTCKEMAEVLGLKQDSLYVLISRAKAQFEKEYTGLYGRAE